MGPLATTF